MVCIKDLKKKKSSTKQLSIFKSRMKPHFLVLSRPRPNTIREVSTVIIGNKIFSKLDTIPRIIAQLHFRVVLHTCRCLFLKWTFLVEVGKR